MQKRDSILSSLLGRGTKDKDAHREPPSAAASPSLEGVGLSPQASSSSARSLAAPAHRQRRADPGSVGFKIMLETPPAIMYGSPQESAGALISGICDVDLTHCGGPDGVVDLAEVSMSLVQEIVLKVPPHVAKKMGASQHQRNVLATWDILKHPHILASTTFAYPFSHLLPGTLPPTSRTNLFTVEYAIEASATTKSQKRSEARLALQIGRSVMHVADKTSVRIFPPTSLTLSMALPTALFPNSQVAAELRIEGLVSPPPADATGPVQSRYKRWQLKRINWRVDETTRVKWGESKDEEYEFKQTLGFGQHKAGWKTDYALETGHVEFSTPDFCPGVLRRATKDLSDPVAGLSVSHQLICELLTAEELLASPQAKQGMLSGSARVLRMQFSFPVLDRPGLGISWEDEVPPMYADVPLSPPTYAEVADLPAFEEFRTNALVFSPLLAPVMSPTMRHFDPTMRGFEHHPGARAAHSESPSLRPATSPLLTPLLGPSHAASLTGPSAPPSAAHSAAHSVHSPARSASPSAAPSTAPSAAQSATPSAAQSATHSLAPSPASSVALSASSSGELSLDGTLAEPMAPPKLRHRQS